MAGNPILDTLPLQDNGLSVIHHHESPVADVIFVHGLAGHPIGTWSHVVPKTKEFPESKVFWPKDLLPFNQPNVRILTFGYDSDPTPIYQSSNQNGIFQHSRDLLFGLARERPRRRAIVFVTHSLGGILVKEALFRSEHAEDDEVQDVFRSTKGVIFMGTPHRGVSGVSDFANIVRSAASKLLRMDSNNILDALKLKAEVLEPGRESFISQWRRVNFRVKTFHEARGLSGLRLGSLDQKVVPDFSSRLDDPRERPESIDADHLNMCKFSSGNDPKYRQVAGEIKSMVRHVSEEGTRATQDTNEFLRSLHFDAMYQRAENIRRPTQGTCSWIVHHSVYQQWFNRLDFEKHHGLLWIKGKPGSGKSTIMKTAFDCTKLHAFKSPTTSAAFFFNARGKSKLERTISGLYRSLLHQVLQQDRKTLRYLLSRFQDKKATRVEVQWSDEELRELLFQTYATSESKAAYIFIDALDECDDDDVNDVITFFRLLTEKASAAGAHLNVCFSTRHYPQISIARCPEIIVETNNTRDIMLCIDWHSKYEPSIAALKDEIMMKSGGVFLWVVLTISILRKNNAGKSTQALRKRIDQLPNQLESLYPSLFSGMDATDVPQAIALFQLVLFANNPLGKNDLITAIAFGAENGFRAMKKWWKSDDFLEGDDKRHERLISLSRGLIEPRPNPENTRSDGDYQVIHETVREFFLRGDGFHLLSGSPKAKTKESRGDSVMATICIKCLGAAGAKSDLQVPVFSWSGLIFVHYAARYLFEHIEAAEAHGVSQEENLRRIVTQGQSRVLENLSGQLQEFEHPGRDPLNEPLMVYPRGSLLFNLCMKQCFLGAVRLLKMGVDVNFMNNTRLRYAVIAAVCGHHRFSTFLLLALVTVGANVSVRDKNGLTTVHWLATLPLVISFADAQERLLCLLGAGADINARTDRGRTPLVFAAREDRRAGRQIVKLLLSCGADANAVDQDGNTPLHAATESLNWESVSVLLELGARGDQRNSHGESALDLLTRLLIEKDRKGCPNEDSEEFKIIHALLQFDAHSGTLHDLQDDHILSQIRQQALDHLYHAWEQKLSLQDQVSDKDGVENNFYYDDDEMDTEWCLDDDIQPINEWDDDPENGPDSESEPEDDIDDQQTDDWDYNFWAEQRRGKLDHLVRATGLLATKKMPSKKALEELDSYPAFACFDSASVEASGMMFRFGISEVSRFLFSALSQQHEFRNIAISHHVEFCLASRGITKIEAIHN